MKYHKLCKNSLIGIIKTGNKERNSNNSVAIKMSEKNMKKRKIFKNNELSKMKGHVEKMSMKELMNRGYINSDDVYCKEGYLSESFGFIDAIFTHEIHGDMMKFHGDEVEDLWKPILIG